MFLFKYLCFEAEICIYIFHNNISARIRIISACAHQIHSGISESDFHKMWHLWLAQHKLYGFTDLF